MPPAQPAASETASAASPAPPLNRLEVLRGLRVATWEGSFATVWGSLTTGAFLTGFALWLGAGSVEIGLLTAIPVFAGLIQVLSSYFGERLKARKPFVAWFGVAGRMLWLPILLLPLFLPLHIALIGFLILFTLSYVLLNIPAPAYMSWMSDLVPPDHRGRYFGQRNMIMGIVGMALGLPAAWFLDVATRRHHWETLGFGTLFGIGVVGGLFSFVCIQRQPEPPKRALAADGPQGLAGILDYYRAPFADPNFRRMMLFNSIFGIGQNIAAPFFTVYALKVLNFNYVWLQIFATIASVASLASMPLWGYLTDKFGNKPMLIIGILGVLSPPLSWMLATAENRGLAIFLLIELNIFSGLFWALVGLTQFNLLIRLSPPERTPIYVATMAAVTGLIGGASPLLGGVLMHLLDGWHTHLLGLDMTNYHLVFFASALARAAGLLLIRPLHDERASSARDVLQQLGRANLRSWRHIRKLQRGGPEEDKLRATGALAEARTRLAVSELEATLGDPSLAVREEAARALGEIGDPGSVDALVAALRDPAAGLIDEAAAALARIGDRRANSALAAILREDDCGATARDRVAVARALGRLGGSDAVDALLEALEKTQQSGTPDDELAETLVYALGRTGSSRAAEPLGRLLCQAQTSRSVRLALARALGEIGNRSALAAIRQELEQAGDDEALLPLLADALARLSDTDAIWPLLDRLSRLESPVARKQVARAIGMLMGIGEGVYGLLAQEEFARDAGVSRLVQEMQRLTRGTPAEPLLRESLTAYTTGDYAGCLRFLGSAAQQTPELSERGEAGAKRALCAQFLADLRTRLPEEPPLESVLLAFQALRRLLPAAPVSRFHAGSPPSR